MTKSRCSNVLKTGSIEEEIIG